MSQYNLRNPAVKRLMKEAEELYQATDEYHAQPLEDNLFEWHFSIKGPPNSDFEGGIYHGRITLPPDYPMKPPSIILLTPNGRFETNKKICLSISGYHPESWQPSWSIRTALLAIIGFMPTHGNGALGSLDYTPAERQQLALKSQEFRCPDCGLVKDIFSKRNSLVNKDTTLKQNASSSSSNGVPDLPSKNVNKIANTTSALSGQTVEENVSNIHHLQKDTSNSDERHSLVHRHANSESKVMSDETSHIENISDTAKKGAKKATVAASESGHNLLYLGLMFVIVFMLTILFLRRIYVIY